MFFLSSFIGEKSRKRLDVAGLKIKRWAFIALFLVASTPLPDEPVVVPLGLIKYSPIKFYLSYFLGKLSIAIIGAYLAKVGQQFLAPWISPEIFIVVSIVLTIIVTIVLLKLDVEKMAEKIFKRKGV